MCLRKWMSERNALMKWRYVVSFSQDCRDVFRIVKRCNNFNDQLRGFCGVLRNLTTSRIAYWRIKALCWNSAYRFTVGCSVFYFIWLCMPHGIMRFTTSNYSSVTFRNDGVCDHIFHLILFLVVIITLLYGFCCVISCKISHIRFLRKYRKRFVDRNRHAIPRWFKPPVKSDFIGHMPLCIKSCHDWSVWVKHLKKQFEFNAKLRIRFHKLCLRPESIYIYVSACNSVFR